MYAADIVLVWRAVDALKEAVKKLKKAAGVMGLTVNTHKPKYMEVTKKIN